MKKFGIDISKWQRGFNFAKAKAEGVEFAILKCSQADYIDPEFENHYNNAKANNIPVGAYHFFTATTEAEAIAEARTCLNAIKGKKFEYPIFLDFENSAGVDYRAYGKMFNSSLINAFCETIENAGYWVGFYCNYDFYCNVINGAEIAKRYSLWLASWSKDCPADCQMWQFGGETNKIRTNQVADVTCDQNYCSVDYPAVIKEKGLNGYSKSDNSSIAEGDSVYIKKGAKDYNGTSLKSFVYDRVNVVSALKGDRAVLKYNGVVVGAFNVKDLSHKQ